MATITEDYVSFETAKLLKERNFECVNPDWYYVNGKLVPKDILDYVCLSTDEIISVPTLQMAMKWLRKERNVHVQIEYERHAGYNKYGYTSTLIFTDDLSQTYVTWKPSYEEAAEFAIKYYLENPT